MSNQVSVGLKDAFDALCKAFPDKVLIAEQKNDADQWVRDEGYKAVVVGGYFVITHDTLEGTHGFTSDEFEFESDLVRFVAAQS